MQQYPNSVQPNYDVNDLIKGIRLGLSDGGKLYAVPFYGESSMLFYNKKMFAAAGLKMPAEPTWDQVREFARKLHNPAKKQYGIALRGLPGWARSWRPWTRSSTRGAASGSTWTGSRNSPHRSSRTR